MSLSTLQNNRIRNVSRIHFPKNPTTVFTSCFTNQTLRFSLAVSTLQPPTDRFHLWFRPTATVGQPVETKVGVSSPTALLPAHAPQRPPRWSLGVRGVPWSGGWGGRGGSPSEGVIFQALARVHFPPPPRPASHSYCPPAGPTAGLPGCLRWPGGGGGRRRVRGRRLTGRRTDLGNSW